MTDNRVYWWSASTDDVGALAYEAFKHNFEKTADARRSYEASWEAYSGSKIDQTYPIGTLYNPNSKTGHAKLPLTRAVIDSVMSLIACDKVRPFFTAERNATFEYQEKSEAMLAWTDGLFEQNDTFRKMREAALLGMVCGQGIIKVGYNGQTKGITHDIVQPWDLVIPPEQLIRGRNVNTAYHVSIVDRDILSVAFGDMEAISEASLDSLVHTDDVDSFDAVTLVEAFRVLPNGRGRRVLMTNAGVIQDEVWPYKRLPFAVWRFNVVPGSQNGIGLVPILEFFQDQVDALGGKIARACNGPSVYFLVKDKEAPTFRMTNKDWAQVTVMSENPVVATPAPINPVYMSLLAMWWDKAFEVLGINKMAAYGEKPPRLESGEALSYYNEIQAQRLGISQLNWQEFAINVTKISLDFAHDHPSVVSRAIGDGFTKKIKFKDIALPEDSYEISVHPTSFLPKTPSGKIEQVGNLLDRFPEMRDLGLRMMDIKDDHNLVKFATAKVRIMQYIDNLLAKGIYTEPEPHMLPHMAFYMSNIHAAYLNAISDEKEEIILDGYRRWLNAAAELQQSADEAAMQAQLQQIQAAQMAQQPPAQAAQAMPPTQPQGAITNG